MPFLTLLALLLAPAQAEEPCAATHDDVTAASDKAFEAFLAMDVEGFEGHAADAAEALSCLREPLSPEDAAAYHRLQALSSFLARDTEAAVARFRSSRVIDPDARLPEAIAPGGHPLDGLFRRADPKESGAIAPIEPPEGGRVWVDGSADAPVRPADRPSVIQLAGPDDVVVRSEYVPGPGAGPDWEGVRFATAPRAEPVEPTPEPEPRRPEAVIDIGTSPTPAPATAGQGRAGAMGVIAGVAAVTSLGCYAAASSSRASFDDPATAFEDLDGLRARTNGLVAVSGIAAGAAVGFGIGAVTIAF